MRYSKLILWLTLTTCLYGCGSTQTKKESFPLMYTDQKPTSILVMPAINNTTASDASSYINATLTQPFADAGYYVYPISLTSTIFDKEGILDGKQIASMPKAIFKKSFGADSVLFVTINKWDKNYAVLAANVTVGMSYVLISTISNEILWSYDHQIVIDTGGDSSAGLIGALIATAINTAVQDYIPIAHQVNTKAVQTMPVGKYHPDSGEDGETGYVSTISRDRALNQ